MIQFYTISCHFCPPNMYRGREFSQRGGTNYIYIYMSHPYLDFEELRENHKEGIMDFVEKFRLNHNKSLKITKFRLSCKHACDNSHINFMDYSSPKGWS
ncbi:hypothetical protein Patl1_04395 [Pistacia atlantica]|uniref:Uncharacterized protein n=1 Tax=Pistacia atlantica TaxID=434234 RepID=A0ACC1BWJ2_9ROSI|nr:hypothetical protein Patl1_04395 [Pistacia atlantica]